MSCHQIGVSGPLLCEVVRELLGIGVAMFSIMSRGQEDVLVVESLNSDCGNEMCILLRI